VMNSFFNLLVALVGNLVFCLRAKSETKSVTPDTAFRFNSKDSKRHLRRGFICSATMFCRIIIAPCPPIAA
jgi:hypothetical protein